MIDFIDDFRRLTRLSEAFHRAQVVHDLNNDMAGREVGRIERVRFEGVSPIEARKRRDRMDRLLFDTVLAALLADPIYRARHEAFGAFLDTYQAATEVALDQAMDTVKAAKTAVQNALSTASTLNGRAVFVTREGQIVYADGTEIDPAKADQIEWRKGAKTYEDYLALIAAAEAAEATLQSVRAYDQELKAARETWASPDKPYGSVGEMDAEENRLIRNAPDVVKAAVPEAAPAIPAGDQPIAAGKLILGE